MKITKISKDKKSLLENFLSLSILQGLNMILPLITFPYLVRILGIENFGLINFSLSVIGYFNILVGFGFELSATKDISINKENKEKISEIFSSVLIIKLSLFVFSLFVLTGLVLFVDDINKNFQLYYTSFGIILGNMLFPSWFFQGMERMKYITLINLVTKIAFTILIFFLLKEKNDYIVVPLLNSAGAIIGGIAGLWIIRKSFAIKLFIPKKSVILEQVKDSYYYFISRIANDGSRYLATSLIGVTFGNTMVGYYSLVEKLFYAFTSIGGLVSQTIYPYMTRTRNLDFFKKVLGLTFLSSFLIISVLMIFNEYFLNLIFDVQNEMASNIFLIVFSGGIFHIVSSIIGYPLLAAFGFSKHANNSLIYSSIIYVVYLLISLFLFKSIYSIASANVIYALTGLLFRIYYIKKTKIFNPSYSNGY